MPRYSYICKSEEHSAPVFVTVSRSIKDEEPGFITCPVCRGKALREYNGQNFYAIVPGAHGGGPATR